MKQLILFSVSTLCFILNTSANDKAVNRKDTVQLKQRIEYLEKQVAALDSQIKVISTRLSLTQPVNNAPKKMVIDRRGSKQVRFE